jgi:formate-dependent phosphoribosylglycinamide formyltransferase (GAR transformylase)
MAVALARAQTIEEARAKAEAVAKGISVQHTDA